MKNIYTVLAGIMLFTACKKDYNDPSGPTRDQAVSSPNALTAMAVGLQNIYTFNRTSLLYTSITASSLLTGETFVVNAGNTDENQLYLGGNNVQNTNTIVTGMWTVANKVIYDANRILENTDAVVADPGYASGLVAYTTIFKSLAIGTMASFWEHVPDTTGLELDVDFISSQEGFRKAVALIDNALARVNANAISSTFINNVPDSIDIVSTLYALKARYALFAGDYDIALAATENVSPYKLSVFSYNSLNTNPIFTLVTSTNNIYQVTDSTMSLPVGLRPAADDKRYPFYVLQVNTGNRFRVNGFYATLTRGIPVYLPGEIALIRAECYARKDELLNGLTELNKVVTRQPDRSGVGAGLTAETASTIPELLDLIYKHRRIELFMAGLALEDERRFGRPASERKRTYFPFPFCGKER